MYFIIIVAIAAVDQILKYMAKTGINAGTSIPVFGDFLTLTIHYNTGAAFSIMLGARTILTIIPLVMVLLVITYICIKRKTEHWLLLTALSLIGGGGIGNLIDRIIFGRVTDYISVGTFPVFNFADMCVVAGCGLVIIYLIFFDNKAKQSNKAKWVDKDVEKKNG